MRSRDVRRVLFRAVEQGAVSRQCIFAFGRCIRALGERSLGGHIG
ncbi:hypothetical protein [Haladaptatus halobius]|nr:hypothetical protein [Haladaptatus halobius]